MQLQWVDILIIGIMGLSALTGLFRGFIKELIALGIWILAIWAGYNYAQSLDPWLQTYIQDKSIRTLVAFLIILMGIVIAGGIVNAVLSLILRSTGLSGMDKILGMVFGFVRGVFIIALIMATVSMTSLPYQQYEKNSRLYPQFAPIVRWISGYLPKLIQQVKSVDKTSALIDLDFEQKT